MRRILLFVTLLGSILLYPSLVGAFVPEDDIYFSAKDQEKLDAQRKKQEAEERTRRLEALEAQYRAETAAKERKASSQEMSVDAYNRRYTDEAVDEAATYDASQEPQEEGYYLNGFNGDESDYQYAERIRKFYNPQFTIHISNPAYNDLRYLNNYDWNVYVSGNNAWVTPTWSNPLWWNMRYTPFSYANYWGYNPYYYRPNYHHSYYPTRPSHWRPTPGRPSVSNSYGGRRTIGGNAPVSSGNRSSNRVETPSRGNGGSSSSSGSSVYGGRRSSSSNDSYNRNSGSGNSNSSRGNSSGSSSGSRSSSGGSSSSSGSSFGGRRGR